MNYTNPINPTRAKVINPNGANLAGYYPINSHPNFIYTNTKIPYNMIIQITQSLRDMNGGIFYKTPSGWWIFSGDVQSV